MDQAPAAGSRRVTVLYLVPTSAHGGAETFLLHTARFHDRESVEPVYFLFRDGPLAGTLSSSGARVILERRPPRLRRPWSMSDAVSRIRRVIREDRVSVVHSTKAYGALFGAPAASAEKVAHVWFQHGPVSGWKDRLASWLPSKAVLVNSRYTLERQRACQGRLGRAFGPRAAIEVVPLGADLEAASRASDDAAMGRAGALRMEWGLAPGDFVAGMACRIAPFKGVELFIHAVSKARASTGRDDIRGVVLGASAADGGESEYEREVRKLASRLGGAVVFPGPKEDALVSMAAMDVVVSSSVRPEGFGYSLVEGMALGKPVIAPRQGGPAEIVRSGENGYLFAPRSREDLARVLALLAGDSRERERIGGEALRDARARFDAREGVRRLEAIYRSILEA